MMPEPSRDPIRATALKLFDRHGWFVFPADPNSKKPYYGFRWKPYGDNLPDRETIAGWPEWRQPGARVGVRTGAVSKIIVLDVDSEEAHRFIKDRGHPVGPMARSPREGGGLHLYFGHPGFYVKSTVTVGGVEGLDVRGDGGIVIAPPSLDHKSGRPYEWIIPPEDAPIPKAPAWLVDLLQKQSAFKEPLDVAKTMGGVPEGKRDTELNRLAGKFRYMNLPQDVAERMIEEAAGNCNPPFNRAEARSKVRWAYTHYEPGEEVGPTLNISPPDDGKQAGSKLFLRTGRELMAKEFPPVKWVVPGLIPAGSMLFGGAPKMGKSWLALGLCISVATGGKALGSFAVEEGDSCYLALEDVERRLQDRAGQILKSDLAGHQDLARWQYTETAARLDQGLVNDIEEEFLKKAPSPRLVVVDTLAAVRGPSQKGRNLYEQDYEAVKALHQLAGAYQVAMLIVTHLNQGEHKDTMNKITGSAGLTGGVDGSLVLDRVRGEADAVLYAWHRDLKEDPEIALSKVDATEGWWRYIGDAEEYRLSKEKRAIMEALANADEPLRPADVADALEQPVANVNKTMQRMRNEGLLKNPSYGKYEIAPGVGPPSRLVCENPVQPVQVVQVESRVEALRLDPQPPVQVVQPVQVNPNVQVEEGHLDMGQEKVSKFYRPERGLDKGITDELGHLDSLDNDFEEERVEYGDDD